MKQPCNMLLLEDEPLILMDLEFAAEDRGCTPHCVTDVAGALALINAEPGIDVAIMDVSLKNGETCVAVAEELERRGIPYLLHSGDLNRADETISKLGRHHIPKPADSLKVIEAAIALLEPEAQAIR
ncbi:MAG: response regulator [Erythrobacter sp.]|nr:MAG: response regulator [Erythrobacter sp.]